MPYFDAEEEEYDRRFLNNHLLDLADEEEEYAPASGEQNTAAFQPPSLWDGYYEEDEDLEPYVDQYEVWLEEIRDMQFAIQDSLMNPRNNRRLRPPILHGHGTYTASNGVGRKPRRKHRDRRPELRETLQQLFDRNDPAFEKIDPDQEAELSYDGWWRCQNYCDCCPGESCDRCAEYLID